MAQKLKDTGQRICEVCNNSFSREPGYPIGFFNRKRTCSPKCYGVLRKQNIVGFKKGHKPFSEKGRFKKGQNSWNKDNHVGFNNALDIYYQNGGERARGSSHYNWKGGVTILRKQIQDTYLYKKWRKDCFERDNYTCQHCGAKGVYLHVDHIKPYSKIIKEYNITTVEQAKECIELWDILNGRTLCVACHKNTDTYGKKV